MNNGIFPEKALHFSRLYPPFPSYEIPSILPKYIVWNSLIPYRFALTSPINKISNYKERIEAE
jgi:hypothetical protein